MAALGACTAVEPLFCIVGGCSVSRNAPCRPSMRHNGASAMLLTIGALLLVYCTFGLCFCIAQSSVLRDESMREEW